MTLNTKLQKIAEIPLTTNELSPVDNQSVDPRGWVESLLSTNIECLYGNLKLEHIPLNSTGTAPPYDFKTPLKQGGAVCDDHFQYFPQFKTCCHTIF